MWPLPPSSSLRPLDHSQATGQASAAVWLPVPTSVEHSLYIEVLAAALVVVAAALVVVAGVGGGVGGGVGAAVGQVVASCSSWQWVRYTSEPVWYLLLHSGA